MKRQAAGFSIVELLVVVGLIAVLIAVLVPSLGVARRQAQLTQCANNLRQVGLASIAYAQDFRGSLPIITRSEVPDVSTLENATWFAGGAGSPSAYGMGLLTRGRYLANDLERDPGGIPRSSMFFCPAQDEERFGVGNATHRTSYYYNPHVDTDAPTGRNYTTWPRLGGAGGLPSGRALAMDLMYDQTGVAHVDPACKYPAWNLLFPDGHVQTVVSQAVYGELLVRPTQWIWARFEDYSDMVESAAAGLDITTQGLRGPLTGGLGLYHLTVRVIHPQR